MAVLDVIKFGGLASRDWLVYKHPRESITMGSQLIVGEGQVAIFVKGGAICDVFTPGTYTITFSKLFWRRRLASVRVHVPKHRINCIEKSRLWRTVYYLHF